MRKVTFAHFIDEEMKPEDTQPVWEDAVTTPSSSSSMLFPFHPPADCRFLFLTRNERNIGLPKTESQSNSRKMCASPHVQIPGVTSTCLCLPSLIYQPLKLCILLCDITLNYLFSPPNVTVFISFLMAPTTQVSPPIPPLHSGNNFCQSEMGKQGQRIVSGMG